MNHPSRMKFVMIGDSVTDCGRDRQLERQGSGRGLGDGYVACFDALWRINCPETSVHVLNVGISGDTIRHLAARWDRDVIGLAPDWLSVAIGINDVWRQFDPDPLKQREAVPPDEFLATYDRLLARVRPNLRGLVLLTPFYIQPDRTDPMRARMDQYGALVHELASRHGAVLVDTQQAFDRIAARVPVEALSGDRVHPTLTGHLTLATTLLRRLDVRWPAA
jgi:lysophospholipase L1-like esterase